MPSITPSGPKRQRPVAEIIHPYVILKIAHVIGACVLFGTGLGIAFFMCMANRTAEQAIIAVTVGAADEADQSPMRCTAS